MSEYQATYAEIADVLAALPLLMREGRRKRRLSLSGYCEETL